VRIIRQENAGAAAARNRALSACSGDFVLFLDADDLIDPRHIASLHAAIADASGCIAVSQWDRFTNAPNEAAFPHRPSYRNAPGVDWLLDGQTMLQPGMFLIPRALLVETGGWDERLSLIDDFEFFTRVIARSAGVRYASGARLYHRSGLPGSLSGSNGRKAAESACLSLMLGTRHLLDVEDSQRTRRACADALLSFEHIYYPAHADLRARMRARVAELGGSDLVPVGPPGFHKLRRFVGWRAARRVQHLAERFGLNGAARRAAAGRRSRGVAGSGNARH
jgi:hypothetical protein